MNLVFVIESFGAGVLNAVAMMANELALGNKITVVHDFREDTPENYKSLFHPSVDLIYFPIRRTLFSFNLLSFLRFRRLIKKLAPDILHLHSSFAGALGRLAFYQATDFKVYYSPHAFKFVSSSFAQRVVYFSLEWLLARGASKIIACSQSELMHARRLHSNSLLLENSVDTSRFIEKKYSSSNNNSNFIVGTVGRVVSQKRPDIFARVCEMVKLTHPEIQFRWVGGGGVQFYDDKLKAAGVVRIEQMPPADVPFEINKFDIYIQCSDYEGMPLSVIEAQVTGLACIVSNCDGNRDVVKDSVTGFVVEKVEEYAIKINYLFENPVVMMDLGSQARTQGVIRFDKSVYIDRLLGIYRQ